MWIAVETILSAHFAFCKAIGDLRRSRDSATTDCSTRNTLRSADLERSKRTPVEDTTSEDLQRTQIDERAHLLVGFLQLLLDVLRQFHQITVVVQQLIGAFIGDALTLALRWKRA